ncbi:MAG: 50S ribosomal protein L10 [Rhodothermales bacterium]|nr:50S ribosomal protein L10 [Rhodothermales bacterium]
MPLTKNQKTVVIDEMVSLLENTQTVYLTNFSGLSVDESTALRDRFAEKGVEFKVVKNTLLKLAMERVGGFDDLYDHLIGPTGVALSEEPASPAKVIKAFAKDNSKDLPELKAALVDGSLYNGTALDMLASLKSKDELLGDIVGLLLSPMTNVVGAVTSPGSTLVGVIKEIAAKAEA